MELTENGNQQRAVLVKQVGVLQKPFDFGNMVVVVLLVVIPFVFTCSSLLTPFGFCHTCLFLF